jgi:5'(3')-deoxyribonucleotidase
MRRLVIAVDCDDVLVATTPFLVDAYNRLYGTKATLAQSHDSAFEIWQADEALQIERWGKLIEVDGYRNLGPSPEEARILHELAMRHELHLVTARQEEERAFTQEMLDRELSGVFISMEFVGWGGSKGEVCRRIGADVLIDDNASHLHNAIKAGVPKSGVILFGSYPWNLNDSTNSDLTHCLDWSAVLTAIQLIEGIS